MNVSRVQGLVLCVLALSLSACDDSGEPPPVKVYKVTVATVQSKAVTLTERYTCQIHARHHIEVRAPVEGELAAIPIREGQMVKKDDLLFRVRRLMARGTPEADNADNMISIKAPFDGMVGRLPQQQGSLIRRTEPLTTLSDDSVIRADFNVSEARYLEFTAANLDEHKEKLPIQLLLANGKMYPQTGTLSAIGSEFTHGNVAFRADFPNPDHKLHHGQTGTLLIRRVQENAIVIPQPAAVEFLNKRYVYVVGKDKIVHHREIEIANEAEDLYILKSGVRVGETIVLGGARTLRDGDIVDYEDQAPKQVVENRP